MQNDQYILFTLSWSSTCSANICSLHFLLRNGVQKYLCLRVREHPRYRFLYVHQKRAPSGRHLFWTPHGRVQGCKKHFLKTRKYNHLHYRYTSKYSSA